MATNKLWEFIHNYWPWYLFFLILSWSNLIHFHVLGLHKCQPVAFLPGILHHFYQCNWTNQRGWPDIRAQFTVKKKKKYCWNCTFLPLSSQTSGYLISSIHHLLWLPPLPHRSCQGTLARPPVLMSSDRMSRGCCEKWY